MHGVGMADEIGVRSFERYTSDLLGRFLYFPQYLSSAKKRANNGGLRPVRLGDMGLNTMININKKKQEAFTSLLLTLPSSFF